MSRMIYAAETVYPSRAGGFPPASFFTFADSLRYARELQEMGIDCGISICPAWSFEMHWKEVTERNVKP